MVSMIVTVAACGVENVGIDDALAGSAPVRWTPSTLVPPARPDEGKSPSDHEIEHAVGRLRAAYVSCVTQPEHCDQLSVVVPRSPAASWLRRAVAFLDRWNLGRAADIAGDQFTVREVVTSSTNATVLLCIANDLPLVDRNDRGDPADDIAYPNPLISTAVEWRLRRTTAGWRIAAVAESGRFPLSETCEPGDG
jgi:hypothetical protein